MSVTDGMTDAEVGRAPKVGRAPEVDPELRDLLAAFTAMVPSTITPDMLAQLRATMATMTVPEEDLSGGGRLVVERHRVPGPAGGPDVGLLVCRPRDAPTLSPVIYYVHGGGMVMGSNQGNDLVPLLALAAEIGLALVSVDYRLAPENPHPAPVEDCYAGLAWTADHAAELSVDPNRVVIAGASAGGGLAAATALLARDRSGPRLAGQLLLSPMLDDRNDSYSARQMVGIGVWDRGSNEFGWEALLGTGRGTADVDPYAAPARAADLDGLPPTFLDVGTMETFRDEIVDYASRIWRAGGNAELHVWPGGFHGFALQATNARLGRQARGRWRDWLVRILDLPAES
ncbi:alpha/beta hydrolase [Plantactinospora sp. WMMC1484]|uniref:alpha/beta hydrolase n=1 Tax=Plantactinospora sp. WMMC1484 TaxID=3404122 RepID=UPI003BF4C56B